jgi:hypothetical protein
MIAEASVIALLKSTLGVGGSAWGVLMLEREWVFAVIVLIPLALCGLLLWQRSHRLAGGKRAEGSP